MPLHNASGESASTIYNLWIEIPWPLPHTLPCGSLRLGTGHQPTREGVIVFSASEQTTGCTRRHRPDSLDEGPEQLFGSPRALDGTNKGGSVP